MSISRVAQPKSGAALDSTDLDVPPAPAKPTGIAIYAAPYALPDRGLWLFAENDNYP
jgi:hypothetical protein